MQNKIKLIEKYKELTESILDFNEIIKPSYAQVYQLGALDLRTKSPKILKEGEAELAKEAYQHFKLDAGDTVKHVIRYPGILAIDDQNHFNQIKIASAKINLLKKDLKLFLKKNGKPAYFINQLGEQIYAANDLLFKTLPMVNQLMTTRQIDCLEEPVKNYSFSWNIDFIHQKVENFEDYKIKILKKFYEPPADIHHTEWQRELENFLKKIDEYRQKNIELRIIRPKPIEPAIYISYFSQKPITLKPKLPIIIYVSENVKLQQKQLKPAPHHPDTMTHGRKYRYEKLSKHFYLYACHKI
ncbi:hypothetical protein [Catenovulum sediminis]|uniref:hypothetical protein n=1 Tax=Catenovulum sediminis TaxID=1740262 RepID=UPI00117F8EA8|nr:hypothetical protein [Catenovulum sediminis]